MSTGSPSLLQPRTIFTPSVRISILVWLILVVGAFVLYSMNESRTSALRDDLKDANTSIVGLRGDMEASRPKLVAELERARQESTVLVQRLEKLESVMGDGSYDRKLAEVESQRAVQQAKLAELSEGAEIAVRHLAKLRKLQTDWAALEEALLRGDLGRRIVASPDHLRLAIDILQRERPTTQLIAYWEQKLNALTEPITRAPTGKAAISVTDEHVRLLSDLGQLLATRATDLEQQKLVIDSIQRETSSLPAGGVTLEAAMEQHRERLDRLEAERIVAARQAVRLEAEKEQTARVVAAERELIEAKTKREEERIRAEKAREEQLARLEQEQIAEEARVQEAQRKATIAGLIEEVTQVEEARRWAQLEREMERDKEQIRGYLVAFTAAGFKHRDDDVKGPASFAQIQGSGALESTQAGMLRLVTLACAVNDRPRGALPYFIGGDLDWREVKNSAPVEKAQALLKKYGELMVRKGMLAP
jgi:hypothetical protein